MFNHVWRNRIKLLENKVAKMEQEKACALGSHDWEMVQSVTGGTPWIRCKNCYATPKNKT